MFIVADLASLSSWFGYGTLFTCLDKYIEDIQNFGMNMPFISSSEAKNAYVMSGEATNEIYIFLLHEMK